jgi:signal transduction histidine kinase
MKENRNATAMRSGEHEIAARAYEPRRRADRRNMTLRKQSFGLLVFIPAACFFVLAVVTHFVAQELDARMKEAAQLRFGRFAADTSNKVAGQLTRYVDLLPGVRGLWESDGFPTRTQFDSYAKSLQIRDRFPSLLYVNYADFINTDNTAAFEATAKRQEGLPDFSVYPRKTPHSHRLVIRYVFPESSRYNGRDILANFATGSAIYKNVVNATQPYGSGIAVSKEGDRSGPALGFRLAVYRGGGVPTPTERAHLVLGSVGIFVDVIGLIHEAVQPSDWDFLSMSMRSLPNADDSPAGERRLFTYAAQGSQAGPQLAQTTTFQVATRTFELTMHAPLARFEDPVAGYIGKAAYLVGLFLALVTSAAIFLLLRSRTQLMHTVNEQSSTLESTRVQLGDLLERQLQAEREVARQAEQERQRIGKELHDDLGQRLTGASLMLRTLQQSKRKAAGGDDSHGIEHVATIVEGGIDTIRMLARGLSPFDGQEQNLAVALTELCGEVNRLLPGGCAADIEFDTELLSADESLHLYRIAQESISNALRHAAPSRLAVRLLDVDGHPQLEIEDDGIGLPEGATGLACDAADVAPPGLGLRSIRSRAQIIGLTVHIAGNPAGGTIVRIGPA